MATHYLMRLTTPDHKPGDPCLLDILPDGRFLVRGREVETGEEVRDALVAFGAHCTGEADALAFQRRVIADLTRERDEALAKLAQA